MEAHQKLLWTVLPLVFKTHHVIAYHDHEYHETNDEIGKSIKNDLAEMVKFIFVKIV